MKRLLSLVLTLVLLLGCVSFAAAEDATPKTGGTLTLGIHITPESLWNARDNGGIYWLTYAAEQLAYYDTYKGELTYQLATDLAEDFDEKSITVTLRDGVKFHDGSALNAEAVIWNLQMYVDSGFGSNVGNPTKFEIIDDLHFKVFFDTMTIETKTSLGGAWVLSYQTYLEQEDKDYYVTHIVGTGPFKHTEYVLDSHWTFERFDEYWGGVPYLDKIVLKRIADRQALITAFVNKDIDMVYTGNETYLQTLTQYGYQPTFDTSTASINFVFPNVKAEGSPWADINVRKAVFLYGIDFDALVYAIGGDYAKHYYTYSYTYDWHHKDTDGDSLYDPAKAKEMLTEAGYPNGFDTTLYVEGRYSMEATAMQAALAQVGINANVEITDDVFDMRTKGEFEGLIMFGNQTNVNNYTEFAYQWAPEGWYKNIFAYDEAYLDIVSRCMNAATLEERTAALTEWSQALAYDYCYIVPLQTIPEYYYTQAHFHAFQESFCGTAKYNEHLWWVD